MLQFQTSFRAVSNNINNEAISNQSEEKEEEAAEAYEKL